MRVKDEAKRLEIINQTLEIVQEKGISGLKMASLAKRVGIAPGTLYLYYSSKEVLIVSIYTDLYEEHSQTIHDQMAEDLPYHVRIKNAWVSWFNSNVENHKSVNFIRQVRQSPYMSKLPEKAILTSQRMGNELFNEGKEKGILKNLSNSELGIAPSSILDKGVALIANKELEHSNETIDMLFSMVWDAIKK